MTTKQNEITFSSRFDHSKMYDTLPKQLRLLSDHIVEYSGLPGSLFLTANFSFDYRECFKKKLLAFGNYKFAQRLALNEYEKLSRFIAGDFSIVKATVTGTSECGFSIARTIDGIISEDDSFINFAVNTLKEEITRALEIKRIPDEA